VSFENVNVRLKPDKRVEGFSIRSADSTKVVVEQLNAFVAEHSPNEVLLECDIPIPAGAALWYGYGWNPYCNLVDDEEMAAPAFGPVPLN
jgi:sialate O-acetylesterase